MIKTYLIFFFLILSKLVFPQAQIKFSDSKKNFGFVKQGETVVLKYEFTNTGNQALIINEAKVACSCTSVDYPKAPIAPQQKGTVIITFETKTVYDRQDRTVEIISTALNSPTTLRYKGVVLRKK